MGFFLNGYGFKNQLILETALFESKSIVASLCEQRCMINVFINYTKTIFVALLRVENLSVR